MKRLFTASLIILGIFIITGCAQRKVVQAPEQPRTQAEGKQKAEAGAKDLSKEAITEKEPARTQQAGVQSSARELQAKIKDILFDFDKYDIKDDAKPVLKELASMLSKNVKAKTVIEGHCDERGTAEYNLALGDKRAGAAKAYLVSLGIPSARIDTVSYGKEKPVCTESTEECWAKNRRAHFVLVEESK